MAVVSFAARTVSKQAVTLASGSGMTGVAAFDCLARKSALVGPDLRGDGSTSWCSSALQALG
jgi:hypothetical protein